MKYTEDQVVGQITSNLSIDSSMAAKQNAGAAYANWFYAHHNHGVENQRSCIVKIASVLGIDFDTALRIQAPILSAYSAAYVIGISNEVIFNQHAQVSQKIFNHLSAEAAQHAQAAQRAMDQQIAQAKLAQAQIVAQQPQSSLEAQYVRAQQATKEAYEAQAVQTKKGQPYLAPANSPLWKYLDENSKASALRNASIAERNAVTALNNIKIAEQHQARVAQKLQLEKEEREVSFVAGTKLTENDLGRATKALEVAKKLYNFSVEEVSRALTTTDKDRVTTEAGTWSKIVEARKEIKVQVEKIAIVVEHDRWVAVERIKLEEAAGKVIKSFTSAEKHWALSSKPNNQNEFTFFLNSMCFFPKIDTTTIVTLNLSNSSMDDNGAHTMAQFLSTDRRFSNLKTLDVSGNQITPTGEGYFAKALQNETVQDIIIFLYKFDQYSKLLAGSKLEKIEAIQTKLAKAEAAGIDVKNVVVDKSFIASVKDRWEIGQKAFMSFVKCYVVPDDLQSYTADKIIAKGAPKLYPALNAKDMVVCGFHAIDEAYISKEGVHQLMKELEVLSAGELYEYME